MKQLIYLLSLTTSLNVYSGMEYPGSPDSKLTPGELCQSSTTLRYPERVPYCKRDVSRDLKKTIFENYRQKLGFKLDPQKRQDYKIDHFIPLCAGGSNQMANLWPQHMSLYKLTDPLEALGCEKLAQGKIKQRELIELVKTAKRDPVLAKEILKNLKRR